MKSLITITIGATLIGCSADYHLRKFHEKGGEIKPEIQVVEVSETLRVNGKDSVILLKYPITCPRVEVPEPKWKTKLEYRYKYKVHRDTIRLKQTETKYQYKTVKAQEKPSYWYWWLITGYVLNFIVRNLYFYFRK